jgi:hypothetical protein
MNDERTPEEALELAKKLVAEGKFELADSVPPVGEVNICHIHNGLCFSWNRDGIGFGELTLVVRNGKLCTDREGMGLAFCLDVIRQALEEEVK